KPPEWWEKQKGSRGIRRGQWYRLVFQFPIRVHPGITPILPKTVKQPSTRVITGFMEDLSRKTILYAFGFTRNNAG
ncbi:hypothetical protein, partial [Klebsiella pneumoniae]|uniref:hypothetical protein n=1 Tax=Klebsiella pneumoniae TaxID=573 RepID=UPI0019553028